MSDGGDDNDEVDTASCCCASCGIAEIDDVQLVPCDGCDLVRYCSDECREDHKSEHEDACNKRAAELRDELLFKQPESSHLGDCPICMLPLPLDKKKSTMKSCCSKVVCNGCVYTHQMRLLEMRLQHTCPFCREPAIRTDEEVEERTMKRIEANDLVAIVEEGVKQFTKGEHRSAFEYFAKGAALGGIDAHYELSVLYRNGHGVGQDEGKEIYHLEEAAIGGHTLARHNLGSHEMVNNNSERAMKHFIIAAAQGSDLSIKALMDAFRDGYVSKEDLAVALRAHKAAVDETKSPQRQAAEEFLRSIGFL